MNADAASLEQELKDTRDRLRALETSTEELGSANEKLHAVNRDLSSKLEKLHRANSDLRNLFECIESATIFLDAAMAVRSYTRAVKAIFSSIERGQRVNDIAAHLESADVVQDIEGVLRDHNSVERAVSCRNGKASYLMRIVPYRTAEQEVGGVLLTFFNVTQLVAAEKQQRLLVSELNHRVRNMLQVVIGLCNQTLHRTSDLKQFEQAFMGRMQALARAYELLSRDGWKRVAIADLLRTQLSPFVGDRRFSATGEDVMLTADAALGFGLAVYELATNATKYGALAAPSGQVEVKWRVTQAQPSGPSEHAPVANLAHNLIFEWIERGGPEVSPPTRRGFGSELIERQLRYELNGRAAMAFHKAGLHVTLTVPLSEAIQVVHS